MLYVVGTPIGNLGDFSPRAVEILKQVDFIAAEDTRVTLKLLNHFGIQKPLVSYYEHNLRQRGQEILRRLQAGETAAVVSDAGMPCISDPGEDLVRLCAQAGVEVQVIPGPSAAVSALAVSGLSTSRFTFEGFLSTNRKNRGEHLDSLKQERRTMIFYEAPHKLPTTLEDLKEVFGGSRNIALCRELTKLHEQVLRMDLEQAAAYARETTPRGEYVLVVEGCPEPEGNVMGEDQALAFARKLLEQGEKPTEAARQAAKASGLSKGLLYKKLVQGFGEED